MLTDPVFSFGPREFDEGSPETILEGHDEMDITGACVICAWFRRDVFWRNRDHGGQCFIAAKGEYSTRLGWRFMLKGCDPPYQFLNVQFDIGDGSKLNMYKIIVPTADRRDHFAAFLFQPGKRFVNGIEMVDYTDADGNVYRSEHACPACMIYDGRTERIWRCVQYDENPIQTVQAGGVPLGIGKDSVTNLPKYGLSGAIYELKKFDGDYSIQDVIDYYNATKDNYNHEEPPPACDAGDTRTETCPDGSTIVTHTCADGNWVETGNTCPPTPPAQDDDEINWLPFILITIIIIVAIYLLTKTR